MKQIARNLLMIIGMIIIRSYSAEPIAILKFKGTNVDETQCEIIRNKFQEQFIKCNKFQVIEQDKVDDIIKEKQLVSSGCVDGSCYTAMCEGLGARKVLMGAISRIQSITTISLRIIDARTGQIEQIGVFDATGILEKIIEQDIPTFTQRFIGKVASQHNATASSLKITREPVAVLSLMANGVPKEIADGLTDRLRVELFHTDKFKVMEREQMEDVLKEQGFQQSGCVDQSCVVEVGKLIGVKYMVGGSISKIGKTYTFSARLIDVSSGAIIRSVNEDTRAAFEEMFKSSTKDIAYGLGGLKIPNQANWPFRTALFSAAVFAGAGIGCYLQAEKYYSLYQNEKFDLRKVQSYRTATRKLDVATIVFTSLSIGSVCICFPIKIKSKRDIKIQNAMGYQTEPYLAIGARR